MFLPLLLPNTHTPSRGEGEAEPHTACTGLHTHTRTRQAARPLCTQEEERKAVTIVSSHVPAIDSVIFHNR